MSLMRTRMLSGTEFAQLLKTGRLVIEDPPLDADALEIELPPLHDDRWREVFEQVGEAYDMSASGDDTLADYHLDLAEDAIEAVRP